jgi:ATP-dependent RNA helicase DDX54/DBP10
VTAKRLYSAPTNIQKEVIPVILAKHDVVGMSKTGSGKTAAFLFPMIQLLGEHSKITGCRALILSPSRELSLQTAAFFRQYSSGTTLKSASLIGGEPLPPQFDALTQNPDVLIATPGRLLHVVTETSYSLSRVQYVVIDEADQMFGLGLEPQLTAILQLLPASR